MYDNVRANIQAIIVLWSSGQKFVLLITIVIKINVKCYMLIDID